MARPSQMVPVEVRRLFRQLFDTGDALLIRASGRTDFQNGDAGQLLRHAHAGPLRAP